MSEELTPVVVEELGQFSTDRQNRLYWNRQLIQTAPIQAWHRSIIAFFAFLATVATIANATAAWVSLKTPKPVAVTVQSIACPVSTLAPPSTPLTFPDGTQERPDLRRSRGRPVHRQEHTCG